LCYNPDREISVDHVTYHKLTDSDESLSTVMDNYFSKSNIVGLIIINTTNSVHLPVNFINKRGDPLLKSVYILSSEDGEQLEDFLRVREEVSIQIESDVDSAPTSMEHAGL